MRYVPAAMLGIVKTCLQRGEQVEAVLTEISAINVELLARRHLGLIDDHADRARWIMHRADDCEARILATLNLAEPVTPDGHQEMVMMHPFDL